MSTRSGRTPPAPPRSVPGPGRPSPRSRRRPGRTRRTPPAGIVSTARIRPGAALWRSSSRRIARATSGTTTASEDDVRADCRASTLSRNSPGSPFTITAARSPSGFSRSRRIRSYAGRRASGPAARNRRDGLGHRGEGSPRVATSTTRCRPRASAPTNGAASASSGSTTSTRRETGGGSTSPRVSGKPVPPPRRPPRSRRRSSAGLPAGRARRDGPRSPAPGRGARHRCARRHDGEPVGRPGPREGVEGPEGGAARLRVPGARARLASAARRPSTRPEAPATYSPRSCLSSASQCSCPGRPGTAGSTEPRSGEGADSTDGSPGAPPRARSRRRSARTGCAARGVGQLRWRRADCPGSRASRPGEARPWSSRTAAARRARGRAPPPAREQAAAQGAHVVGLGAARTARGRCAPRGTGSRATTVVPCGKCPTAQVSSRRSALWPVCARVDAWTSCRPLANTSPCRRRCR